MRNSKRKEILILIVCLLIGFTLRFYTFDHKSLWIDEIHTFNESRDGLKDQLKYYQENPANLHPPFFFILAHQFYPFPKPERDLRIFPLIFGILSIPMIYLLARQFSSSVTLPCALSLAFMTYHISLSQDGRSYSLLMFLGMVGLYFLMRHLITSKKKYLPLVALFYSLLFYTSYSSIPFIVLSQILWFYRASEEAKRPTLSSFLILNGLIFLFCFPWILFVLVNYRGQPVMDPLQARVQISLLSIIYGVLNDWTPGIPLIITSAVLLILFPILSRYKQSALLLLTVFAAPIGALYLFCRFQNINHFFTSRYFINFLPLLFVSIYLSLYEIEVRFEGLRKFFRLRLFFVILFIGSNIIMLPLYYTSEKQDFKGLVSYLSQHLRGGDKIFVAEMGYMPGILHYFGVHPDGRHYTIPFRKIEGGKIEYGKSFIFRDRTFTIYHSKNCCSQYITNGGRLWIIAGKGTAKRVQENSLCLLKGYFDGSFLNFDRFPTDASMYLFLWDPDSPAGKGIDMRIE